MTVLYRLHVFSEITTCGFVTFLFYSLTFLVFLRLTYLNLASVFG